jgi:alpha-tubulin suppressor-like RCC1 family protein
MPTVPRLLVMAALASGCGDAVSTGPVAETQFEWFAIGNWMQCGVRDGAGWCAGPFDDALAPLEGPERVREFGFGYYHACALASDGVVWCWGENQMGELGRTSGDPRVPAPVESETRFSAIAAAGGQTCGLDGDGAPWCWGFSDWASPGAWSDSELPADCSSYACLRPSLLPTELRFEQIGLGPDFGCGLARSGEIWCWGLSTAGRLGSAVGGECDSSPCAVPPSRVETPTRFTRLAVAGEGACGLDTDGRAWCWGGGGAVPARAGPQRFVALSGGTQICAIDAGRRAWCWLPAGASVTVDDASMYAPRAVPSLLFDRIFPSPNASGCGWNGVTGAACWSGLDGEPRIVPGQY